MMTYKSEDIKKMNSIELLAPAKNKECAFAAINAGTDALYIGAESFGARKKAGNSLSDLKEITDYAHKFLVKVYVTVNTLIYDNEISAVEKLIRDLYDIGVDAIIFQDFSILNMNLPPIALHASTQCNNDSLEKIQFLKDCNIQRVVLPREFSIEEIKNVTKNIDIETEVFVHGALCVCYSGQCYFSNYIGGRSANRGECAQPCRKKYSLIDGTGKEILKPQYLLSMKDNNLSCHLKELLDAGVTSLKLEGRLKDADYVKNVVSFYRQELDKISKRTSLGITKTDFSPDINKTFNRGYTNFYFDGKRKVFINPQTPKFTGEYAGQIIEIKGNRVKIDPKISIVAGDRISYFDRRGELTGTTVMLADKNLLTLRDIKDLQTGVKIYRNFDAEFNKKLEKSEFIRKIPVHIEITGKNIKFATYNNIYAEYKFTSTQKAKNIEKAVQTFEKQISKLGDSEFFAKNIKISKDFDLFLPVSEINEIRRNLVANLQKICAENYEYQRRNTTFTIPEYPYKELDYTFNVSNKSAKEFFEKAGCNVTEYAPECTKKEHITLMKTKHCLRDFAGMCLKKYPDKKQLYLVDELGKKYKLEFDCKNCVMKIYV